MSPILDKKEIKAILDKEVSTFLKERTTWKEKLSVLKQELDDNSPGGSNGEEVNGDKSKLSPGLKLKHKQTHILYTIKAIGQDFFSLEEPSGKIVTINVSDIKNFELD